jgi:hypothetical protein
MPNDTPEEQIQKKRHRSPSYPTIGLREAVDRLRKFYSVDGKAGATPDIAVKHMGFASAHGQAMSALAALKKFGLVAESNGRMAPTQRALEIINLGETDGRRATALKDAVLNPLIYRELLSEAPNGLPSDEALESELVTYKNFNPNAVKGFVKDFKDSLEFAGLSDLSVLGLDVEQTEEPDMETQTPANLGQSSPHGKASTPDGFVPMGTKPASTAQSRSYEISTPVGRDGDDIIFANVHFSASLKREYVASLKKYLDYLETTLN